MPLRILVAPDKFKGTLTARQAAEAMAQGWRAGRPQDQIEMFPISDGGDGFGPVLSAILGARPQRVKTMDAAHRAITATWWWSEKTKTAVIESANVVGLAMLPRGKFHPYQLDTFGLGDVLRAADRRGAKRILMGIGGSATNDAGFGLARAMGWHFLDRGGKEIHRWTDLPSLVSVHAPESKSRGEVIVAVDVQNPLLGARGATRVYGPQKGLKPRQFATAESGLRRLAEVMQHELGQNFASQPGAGAAGGLGFGLSAFCDAKLEPGFELFAAHARLERALRSADLVLTGEGAMDRSTAMGKGVGQLAQLCRKRKIPCAGLAGCVKPDAKAKSLFLMVHGLTDFVSPTAAMRNPARHLKALAEKVATHWREPEACVPARRLATVCA